MGRGQILAVVVLIICCLCGLLYLAASYMNTGGVVESGGSTTTRYADPSAEDDSVPELTTLAPQSANGCFAGPDHDAPEIYSIMDAANCIGEKCFPTMCEPAPCNNASSLDCSSSFISGDPDSCQEGCTYASAVTWRERVTTIEEDDGGEGGEVDPGPPDCSNPSNSPLSSPCNIGSHTCAENKYYYNNQCNEVPYLCTNVTHCNNRSLIPPTIHINEGGVMSCQCGVCEPGSINNDTCEAEFTGHDELNIDDEGVTARTYGRTCDMGYYYNNNQCNRCTIANVDDAYTNDVGSEDWRDCNCRDPGHYIHRPTEEGQENLNRCESCGSTGMIVNPDKTQLIGQPTDCICDESRGYYRQIDGSCIQCGNNQVYNIETAECDNIEESQEIEGCPDECGLENSESPQWLVDALAADENFIGHNYFKKYRDEDDTCACKYGPILSNQQKCGEYNNFNNNCSGCKDGYQLVEADPVQCVIDPCYTPSGEQQCFVSENELTPQQLSVLNT